ncbi:PAAR domain-containing protein [Marivita sp. S0852]|uniref:PAAR domain-containing protein n=1 Tax=Marivita sp. S0852 TaxID=3373893 RepID=UPI003981C18B
MPQAYRLGDLCTGHDSREPTAATISSGDVFVNGAGLVREGDTLAPHGCHDDDPEARVIAVGSGSVFVNGKPAARSGDPVSCGGFAADGSEDVSIGD